MSNIRQQPAPFAGRSLSAVLGLLALGITAFAAEPQRLKPHSGLKPFEYIESADALPNYVSGAKWGTQTTPIRTMQTPLSPEESLPHLVVPEGFRVQLFAAEPEITKPICMAWDERGRLWIAETVDYPNDMQAPGQGRDRIKVCEDTDGDGKADRFSVFAEKLSIPTSLVFANGGVIVAQAPDMLFLKDNDGDGKADERRVLFTGWGTTDTHAGPSNLRYGFDNWIWGTVGYSGFEGVVGGREHKFGMGIFRFKPDGSELEFIRSSNNNTWGLGLSEDGIVFGSTANGNASMYMAVPNRYYEQVKGWSAARLESIADSQNFYPITSKVRQVDWHDRYTAGAGHALYTARSFPKNFWNRISFVCEPTGHLIGFFELEAKGADFVAHNGGTFLGSDDEWTAPIAAEVGPDGALWMIDWYNYIVQHNPVPNGFKNGRGNAYETTLRDKRHGRIYRVSHKDFALGKAPVLSPTAPEGWVAALQNDNLLWRMHAQRMLVQRGQQDVVPSLKRLVANRSVDSLGLNPGALHALWTLHALQAEGMESIATEALSHPSAAVRRAAATTLPKTRSGLAVLLQRDLLYDSKPQVRLAALLALAEMPASPEAGVVVQAMLQSQANAKDRWMRHAAISAAARHIDGFINAALAKSLGQARPELAEVFSILAGHLAQTASKERLLEVCLALNGSSWTVANPLLEGLHTRWPSGLTPEISGEAVVGLKSLFKSLDPRGRTLLVELTQRWGRMDLFAGEVDAVVQHLRSQLALQTLQDQERIHAAQSLIRLKDSPESARSVLEQIGVRATPELCSGLMSSLGESRNVSTAQEIGAAWKRFTPVTRRSGLTLLMRRAEWADALLSLLERGAIPPADLGPEHWQQLGNRAQGDQKSRLEKLQNAGKPISSDREAVVKRLLPAARKKGDAQRGKEVFTASCAVCHTFAGVGGRVGPDLTGIGARDRAEILTEILDPNRSVEANYRMWTATTRDGDTFSGRLETETKTAVEILDLTGQKHSIQRTDLQSLDASALSIMPVGFESLPESDLSSLLEFLAAGH